MLHLEDVESGARVTHKNTGLRYSIVEVGDDEVLLSPETEVLTRIVTTKGSSS